MAVLLEQLRDGAVNWTDPDVPKLLAWVRAGQRRSELQGLLRATTCRMHTLGVAHARSLLELLVDFELVSLAYALSALPQLASEPEIAAQRARLAMRLGDYASAIAASEVAIGALLQPGLAVDEFLRLCSAGAPAEGMLRFERHVLAERAHLSERLALRWEALHRAGRSRDASLMQLMCQRYFPERASVWATAGNHALDGDDLSSAEAYYRRCLQLDASWPAALAGLAIVLERRKDWAAALPFRRRVLEVTRALESDDAASLQRRTRYAAALARLGQWREAEPLFRSVARSPNIAQLPAEHPVLLRVFSQELYAPALVSTLLHLDPDEDPSEAPDERSPAPGNATPAATRLDQPLTASGSAMPAAAATQTAEAPGPRSRPLGNASPEAPSSAQHKAQPLTAARDHDQPLSAAADATPAATRPSSTPHKAQPLMAAHDQPRAGASGAHGTDGDTARAQREAALRGARLEPALALARHEAALIERLAQQLTAARLSPADERWARGLCAYLAGELEHAYALFDRAELDRPDDLAVHCFLSRCASAVGHEEAASIRAFAEQSARALWEARERTPPSPAQLGYAIAILPELAPLARATGFSVAPDALEELDPIEAPLLVQLERLAAFRVTHQAAGHSPLVAAAASTHALAALTAT